MSKTRIAISKKCGEGVWLSVQDKSGNHITVKIESIMARIVGDQLLQAATREKFMFSIEDQDKEFNQEEFHQVIPPE